MLNEGGVARSEVDEFVADAERSAGMPGPGGLVDYKKFVDVMFQHAVS
jgi:hypothetical protein